MEISIDIAKAYNDCSKFPECLRWKLGIMFDTNIFNRVLDQEVDCLSLLRRKQVYVTEVQWKELGATKEKERQDALLLEYMKTAPITLGKDYNIWQIEDEPSIAEVQDLLFRFLESRKSKASNKADSEIAAVCVVNHMIVATEDRLLREALSQREHMATTVGLDDLISHFKLKRKAR